jgi:hypothetical protein
MRKNDLYQIKCLECPLKYITQTGKIFHTRYKEHTQEIKNNNSNSVYSNRILNTGHTYGTITVTMDIMKLERKGKDLNTFREVPYIYITRSKDGSRVYDTCIDTYNPIFETLHHITAHTTPL